MFRLVGSLSTGERGLRPLKVEAIPRDKESAVAESVVVAVSIGVVTG